MTNIMILCWDAAALRVKKMVIRMKVRSDVDLMDSSHDISDALLKKVK